MEAHGTCEEDDLEIHHDAGKTIIRNLPREKGKSFHGSVKANESGSIYFHGVKKIELLKPGTSEPQQTIYGES